MKIRLHLSLALAASLTLGACDVTGSEGGSIPPDTAAGLQGALSDLGGAISAESCRDARDAVTLFRERIEATGDVSGEVREGLVAGAVQLETLVQEEVCVPSEAAEPTTTTTPTTTTATEPEEEEEKEKEEKEEDKGEDGEETSSPPEGENGPNAPPGPEGNPGQEGDDGGEDSGTGGTGGGGDG
jgi:hypothetical protein